MARIEGRRDYRQQPDECYRGLLLAFNAARLTVKADDAAERRIKAWWHPSDGSQDLLFEGTCVAADGESKSTSVSVSCQLPLFAPKAATEVPDRIFQELDYHMAHPVRAQPSLLDVLEVRERAEAAGRPPTCDDCRQPFQSGKEFRWVAGRLLSEQSVGNEVRRSWGDFLATTGRLCTSCFDSRRRFDTRLRYTLFVLAVGAAAAGFPLISYLTPEGGLSRSMGFLVGGFALLLGMAPIGAGFAILASWFRSDEANVRRYCTPKLPTGAQYTLWDHESFAIEARRRGWG
jgi:hypothetical protein